MEVLLRNFLYSLKHCATPRELYIFEVVVNNISNKLTVASCVKHSTKTTYFWSQHFTVHVQVAASPTVNLVYSNRMRGRKSGKASPID